MNLFEKFSPLLPEDIALLTERKNKFIASIALYSLGFVFGALMFFVLLNSVKSADGALWLFGGVIFIFYFALISRAVRQMNQISREIKRGVRKIVTVRLDDYSEISHFTRKGERRYIYSDYYFHAGGKKYEVSKGNFYKFLNGDLVNITTTTQSEIVLDITKAEEPMPCR